MVMESIVMTIEINNKQPVELFDLTNSFLSLADEYRRFSEKEPVSEIQEVKLYIKEIRTGSIIADIVACAPGVLPYIGYATSVISFSTYLKRAYKGLLGHDATDDNLKGLAKTNYENLSNIVEPVAKDNGSQINIHTTVNGNVTVNFNFNSVEANAIQNRIKREISLLKEPTTGIKEKVLLYWYQARNDPKSKAGDKAVIETIQPTPVKVVFSNEKVKAQMIYGENPFTSAYIVDVEVETIGGRPVIYKVLECHERIDKPPDSKSD